VYTINNSSYSSILKFSIHNLRFATNKEPKPLVIITPKEISHIQATIICSQNHGLQIRIRSGGHDYEGQSYVSDVSEDMTMQLAERAEILVFLLVSVL
jgi:FAD/FMN-containing dehydrogenase